MGATPHRSGAMSPLSSHGVRTTGPHFSDGCERNTPRHAPSWAELGVNGAGQGSWLPASQRPWPLPMQVPPGAATPFLTLMCMPDRPSGLSEPFVVDKSHPEVPNEAALNLGTSMPSRASHLPMFLHCGLLESRGRDGSPSGVDFGEAILMRARVAARGLAPVAPFVVVDTAAGAAAIPFAGSLSIAIGSLPPVTIRFGPRCAGASAQ